MVLRTNNLVLIPSIQELVANLELNELLIKLFKCRFIMLNSQCLIVHRRCI